jgi:hypothetical protein
MLGVYMISIYFTQDCLDDDLPVDEDVTLDDFRESVTV